MGQKILVADDEEGIVSLLKDYLELQGYEVITACGGIETLEKAALEPDMIVLDINMPDMDGLSVCRKIRGTVDCPIVFLSARAQEQDRITGLMLGGDDYIVKPFSIDELGARIKAHLRREERGKRKSASLTEGDLTIRYDERSVECASHVLGLTKTEYGILEYLSLNPGQVFSKERIYERVRGYEAKGDSSIVAEHVRRIRSKIAAYTDQEVIDTVWGVGYRWTGSTKKQKKYEDGYRISR